MTSNNYLAQTYKLTTSIKQNDKSNQKRIYRALRCIGRDVTKVVKAEYVVDMFKDLRKKDTPLRPVSDMCDKLCNDIKQGQKKQIIKTIMRHKQESAHRKLETAKNQYTKTFNDNKQQLINSKIYKQTIELVRNEKSKQRHHYKNKRRNKVKHLKKKNQERENKIRTEHTKQQQEIKSIEGIIIEDQQIPRKL